MPPGVGGSEIDLAQIEPGEVVPLGNRELLPQLAWRRRPPLDRPGRLGEADHELPAGHPPRPHPARIPRLLWRVVNRPAGKLPADIRPRGGRPGPRLRATELGRPPHAPQPR